MLGKGERAPWRQFPKVVRNGDLGSLQNEPEYDAAKAGDKEAALNLVDRLFDDTTAEAIRELIGDSRPLVLPVISSEADGNNWIPLAFAEVLADRLDLDVEVGITQREKIKRTGTGSDYRLAFNPTFIGNVKEGQSYLIVDDTLTMGGAIASLRGYVVNRGGHVVGASVMTAHEGALDLAVKPKLLSAIDEKHGRSMNQYWQETFGYGIDQLTQGEAGHLRSAASVDAIRKRITTARREGIERLDAYRTQAPARGPQAGQGGGTVDQAADSLLEAAESLEQQQYSLLDSAPIEQTYQETLVAYVQSKHDQVERIEDRLEALVDRQQARLQQMQSRSPGFLSLPSTKRAWQTQQAQCRARLQVLHHRLDAVREIKDGMGLHSPKVEELATRKMRAENPELASDWDAMRLAVRQHEAFVKKQAQEQKQAQSRGQGLSQGLSRPK
ncbi:MAG: phosphoribosyltransferase [Candidatus Thiodiazotropha sp.]